MCEHIRAIFSSLCANPQRSKGPFYVNFRRLSQKSDQVHFFVGPLQRVRPRNGILALGLGLVVVVVLVLSLRSEFIGKL